MADFASYINRYSFEKAASLVRSSGDVRETPLLLHAEASLRTHSSSIPNACKIHLKLENAQIGGSFKLRGVVNQIANLHVDSSSHFFTISAGNYGKAFATVMNRKGFQSTVLMPSTAPADRMETIRSLGSNVISVEPAQLLDKVEEYKRIGWVFVESINDYALICGYSSLGFEMIEQLSGQPDILLVPCGGGALLAGISAAFAVCGRKTKIFGVEPETADTMRQSFEKQQPMRMPTAHSIAAGLAPPFAGHLTYPVCQENAAGICTVTDAEIIDAMKVMHQSLGLVVEPSGAAAIAALLFGKVPENFEYKTIVAVVSGGNIALKDFIALTSKE